MTTRWAVLGAARIAEDRFIPAARAVGGEVSVAASRDIDRAEKFADRHAIPNAVDSYQAAISHEQVDAIYVALPNSLHREWVERALLAQKPVLCEKPIAMNIVDAEAIASLSHSSGVPAWESFAFLHQAQTRRVRELTTDGTIGDLRTIVARFHFDLIDPTDIRWTAALGGGAVLDVGCYMLKWARELVSRPRDVHAWATFRHDVDAEVSAVLNFERDISMFMSCGFTGEMDTSMVLYGTEGRLSLSHPWHPGPNDTLTIRRLAHETVERLGTEHSFGPMLEHIHATIQSGEESPHTIASTVVEEARLLERVLGLVRPDRRS